MSSMKYRYIFSVAHSDKSSWQFWVSWPDIRHFFKISDDNRFKCEIAQQTVNEKKWNEIRLQKFKFDTLKITRMKLGADFQSENNKLKTFFSFYFKK